VQVNIFSDSDRRIPRKKIRELISLIEEEEEPPDSTINIIFVRDRKIALLNRNYRGKSGVTDVLSFNIDNEPGESNIFGEIYISTDTAARNAAIFKIGFHKEILHLCCHGLLHLLGYDHEKDDDAEIMEARERQYLGGVE